MKGKPLNLQLAALNNLGLMYASGQGVEQDFAEALRCYRLAAEQGVDSSVEYLIQRWANTLQTNRAGSTPLHSAALLNHNKVIDLLASVAAAM